MIISDLIASSMRKIGAIASGETPTPAEQQDALSSLQTMLQSWAAEKINVFSSVREEFVMSAGTGTYTWGVGGSINTLRPNKILGVSVTDSSDISHPVEIISEGEYSKISSKTSVGRPYALFSNYTFPYVTIYLYPVPNAAETLLFISLKPFTESSSFETVNDTLSLPTHYEEAVIYNLAIRIAPEFGVTIPLAVAAIAKNAYNRLTTLNSANYVEPIKISVPVGAGSRYNINSDFYR